MTIEDRLLENGYEGAVYLSNPIYDNAVIGVSEGGRVIYDYDKMVEQQMIYDGMTAEDAVEWIEYNVIGALPYMKENAPIIMYKLF